MSHRPCKDVTPHCHCWGCKTSSPPGSGSDAPIPRALCPPRSPQELEHPQKTPCSHALWEQQSHDEHARKPCRRRTQQPLWFTWPVEKTKRNETRLQCKQGKWGRQFLKRIHHWQQLFFPRCDQSPIYTPRVETGKRMTTPAHRQWIVNPPHDFPHAAWLVVGADFLRQSGTNYSPTNPSLCQVQMCADRLLCAKLTYWKTTCTFEILTYIQEHKNTYS